MKRAVFASVVTLALAGAGAGVWLAVREDAPAPAVVSETARAALGRALAAGEGVAAAGWIQGGALDGAESGNYARFRVIGADGREAWAYLVRLADGAWKIVSLTEGPPQCAAVERFGFPSAMISDCRVGEAQTVAEALALAIAGGDVSGVRLVGTIELPPDPSCGCVLLTSGGASVRLNLSAADLEAAGISIGDTVVISGGLGDDLSVDATSAILAAADGTPQGAPGSENPSGGTGDDRGGNEATAPSQKKNPATPAPEPTSPAPTGGVSPGTGPGGGTVDGFPEWKPRRRYSTIWYTNPFDLDSSAAEDPNLTGN